MTRATPGSAPRASAQGPTTHRVGPALVLGHDVNTDELHPSRFYSLDDRTVRAGFLGAAGHKAAGGAQGAVAVAPEGPIVIAGRNFGVGSSRETGARVFLLAGVQAVVAESFARIFFRNVSNLGLPALVVPGIRAGPGERVEVDVAAGVVRVGDREYRATPPDPYWAAVGAAGGLAAWLGLDTPP